MKGDYKQMKERGELINIEVERIYPHPNNPRKNVGDVMELTESVKKNGIMQNLTIIPKDALEYEPDEQPDAESISKFHGFYALIGHRRLAAAKAAGLTEVPCRIVSKISLKEQISIMLEENMQRNDLTIYEQAQGFQMMLDLGETAETIAEKTGFSKATVYHRLNLAKLDQKELQEKEKDDSFQMSLKDLYELEKVKDVEVRNKILKEARTSGDLIWKVSNWVNEEKRLEFLQNIKQMLEEKGIKPAPKQVENEQWSNKWETLKEYNMNQPLPDEIKVKAKKTDDLLWVRWYQKIAIIRKNDKKKEKTPEEKRWDELNQRKKKIGSLSKQLVARTKEFIKCITDGKILCRVKETEELRKTILNATIENGGGLYKSNFYEFLAGKSQYEMNQQEKQQTEEKIHKLTTLQILLIAMSNSLNTDPDIIDYYGKIKQENAGKLRMVHEILKQYGWVYEDEEQQLLDGTHELYVKESKNAS